VRVGVGMGLGMGMGISHRISVRGGWAGGGDQHKTKKESPRR
jgi:hypothetical protein